MAVATKVSKVVPVSVPAAAPSTPSATSPATTSPLVVKSVKNATPGLGVQLLTAGTAACIADCITFPLDTVKVRLQVSIQILIMEPCYVFEKILYFLITDSRGSRSTSCPVQRCIRDCIGHCKTRRSKVRNLPLIYVFTY